MIYRKILSSAAFVLALGLQPALAPLAAAKPVAAAASQERLLPLEGGRNFRDLGGYQTADGHTVKWRTLFRSGSMHGLTEADHAYLDRLGLRVVVDFRDVNERAAEPAVWSGSTAPRVLTTDYDNMKAGLMPPGDMRNWTSEQARQAMAHTYPQMLTTFAPQYRRMFAELLANHAPLAFNCSAGKDRTGVAAALVLTALGVPRETVIQDYLLTNKYLNAAAVISGQASANPAFQAWARMPQPVLQAFMAADRSYIEAALAALDAHAGGASGYFKDELGLSQEDIATLRAAYLV
jgi:protein-tyrosine phosphatase